MVEEYLDDYYVEGGEQEATDDEMEDQVEKQTEVQNEVYEDNSPTYKEKDDLYSLFWRVVRARDSSKVGNLDPKTELGMLDISVRDGQRIALLAKVLGHTGFAKFFAAQSEIVLSTSASKKGWLPELFVSQRKYTTKSKELKNLLQVKRNKPLLKQ